MFICEKEEGVPAKKICPNCCRIIFAKTVTENGFFSSSSWSVEESDCKLVLIGKSSSFYTSSKQCSDVTGRT